MPKRKYTRKRDRDRGYRGDLDWFGEDPWVEREPRSLEADWDDWDQELWASMEDEPGGEDDWDEDDWDEDGHDGWGPIRKRRARLRDAR